MNAIRTLDYPFDSAYLRSKRKCIKRELLELEEQRLEKRARYLAVLRHTISRTWMDYIKAQFSAFSWDVKICDGHDEDALKHMLTSKWSTCLMANTAQGKGLSLMENNPAWHWRMPNKRELKIFCAELGISQEEIDVCRKPRVCFKTGNMSSGEAFFRPASGFDAGILTDFKEKPRSPGGKRSLVGAC